MSDTFAHEIREGIPHQLPRAPKVDVEIPRAPRRALNLDDAERRLALRNALRYFPAHLHDRLAPEFAAELAEHGRIYMHRYRPHYHIVNRE